MNLLQTYKLKKSDEFKEWTCVLLWEADPPCTLTYEEGSDNIILTHGDYSQYEDEVCYWDDLPLRFKLYIEGFFETLPMLV